MFVETTIFALLSLPINFKLKNEQMQVVYTARKSQKCQKLNVGVIKERHKNKKKQYLIYRDLKKQNVNNFSV